MSSQQRPLVVYSADSIQLTQPERERLSTLKSASAVARQPVTTELSVIGINNKTRHFEKILSEENRSNST